MALHHVRTCVRLLFLSIWLTDSYNMTSFFLLTFFNPPPPPLFLVLRVREETTCVQKERECTAHTDYIFLDLFCFKIKLTKVDNFGGGMVWYACSV